MAKKKTKARPRARSASRMDSAPEPTGYHVLKPKGGNGTRHRRDGWENVLTGIGTSADKRRYSTFKHHAQIGDVQLSEIYQSNGIGRRVVDLPADQMTRNWFKITNDEDDAIAQKLETLKAQSRVNEALKWARLYGGGIIVIGANDGGELTKPVNEEGIKAVDFLTVFDRRDAMIEEQNVVKDAGDPDFGEPSIYKVIPLTGGEDVEVHKSRVIRFDGALLARRELQNNKWWHQSIIQAAFNHLRQVGAVYDSAEFIMEDFIQTALKIKNLMQLIASGNETLVKQRMNLLDRSRTVANTMLMDSEEDYAKHASAVGGVAEILDRFLMALSSSTGIPVTLLMGRSPAGENATGEADIRFWYDDIRAKQRNDLKPPMEKLIRYIFKSDGFTEPEKWSIVFNPLVEPSEMETSTLYKATAEGDAIYVQNNIAPADAIAKHRFMGDSFDTSPPSIEEDELFPEDDGEPTAAERAVIESMRNPPPLPGVPGQAPQPKPPVAGGAPAPTDTPPGGTEE